MNAEARTLLIVDDDEPLRTRMAKAFAVRGYEIRTATGPVEAVRLAEADSPELALVDLRMPDGSGLDLVKALLEIDPATRIVVLTAYGSIATAVEAVKRGAVHYLTKPADVDEIAAAFDRRDGDPDLKPDSDVPSLARVEWEHINRVLSDCGGNVSKAAKLLGVHRRSLQRKLAKFPVQR